MRNQLDVHDIKPYLEDRDIVWLVRMLKYHRKILKNALASNKHTTRFRKLAIKDIEKTDDMIAKLLGKAKA